MMKEIQLKFPGTLTRLSGNDYGREIYNKQVKDNIDELAGKNVIIISQSITDVGASFIQGFIANFPVEKEKFYKTFEIQANDKIVTKFREVITR